MLQTAEVMMLKPSLLRLGFDPTICDLTSIVGEIAIYFRAALNKEFRSK